MALLGLVAGVLAMVLSVALSFDTPSSGIEIDAADLQASTLERGLRARVGESIEHWHLSVGESSIQGEYRVRMTAPDGQQIDRNLAFSAESPEDRSRELAAKIAFIIEDWELTSKPPSSSSSTSMTATAARTGEETDLRPHPLFIALTPSVSFGAPVDPAGGIGLLTGLWLHRRYFSAALHVDWSRAHEKGLNFDALRFGPAFSAGAPLSHSQFWGGAFLSSRAQWAVAREQNDVSGWAFSSELSAVLRYRSRHFFGGLRAGVDLQWPPQRAIGTNSELRRGTVRGVLTFELGWSQ